MVNKYHMQAIERKANMDRASAKAGINFTSTQQMADYNETLREKKKVYKSKAKKKMKARKGLPTGYDQ